MAQVEYLKATDYNDEICEGWRRYFVCKAGGRDNDCVLGLAYPGKLWEQTGRVTSIRGEERLKPGNWQYKCVCMWESLQ